MDRIGKIKHQEEQTKPETSYDPTKPAKHFRACVIWNYYKVITNWEITQWSIRDAITAYIKWDRGDPQE